MKKKMLRARPRMKAAVAVARDQEAVRARRERLARFERDFPDWRRCELVAASLDERERRG